MTFSRTHFVIGRRSQHRKSFTSCGLSGQHEQDFKQSKQSFTDPYYRNLLNILGKKAKTKIPVLKHCLHEMLHIQ